MKTPARLQSLQDEGLIDNVQRQLMSGEEAMVFVVRCASLVGNASQRGCPASSGLVRSFVAVLVLGTGLRFRKQAIALQLLPQFLFTGQHQAVLAGKQLLALVQHRVAHRAFTRSSRR
jgi:hypothetical protein